MADTIIVDTGASHVDVPIQARSCNLHDDCGAADRVARANGYWWAEHCHDDFCEDCFGS